MSGDIFGRSQYPSPFNFDGSIDLGAVVCKGEEDAQKDFRRGNRQWLHDRRQPGGFDWIQQGGSISARRATTRAAFDFEHLQSNQSDDAIVILASRSTSMWPPWPLSLIQRKKEKSESSTSSSSPANDYDATDGGKREYQYPSMALLMFSYLRQRTRIWVRQLEEIGSQVWFNLPPATPPLVLLASIPRKIVTEDPRTGEEVTRRIFPVFSNPLARSMIAFGLGMAVLSWSQQELKRKRKLTPLPLAIRYESVSRVFLPPFLPEDVMEPELEALDKVVAASSASGNKLFEEEEEDDRNTKVSPKIRKHLNDLYETASNPQRNIQYYLEEWRTGRLARKREAAKIRRLRVFDELVALQALKRKAAKTRSPNAASQQETGFALVTGASEGIGRAIAVELARWEIPLVLVARNVDKLASLGYDLEACYGVKCCVLGVDLSEIDAAEKIHEVTTKAGITIDILVNNAGVAFEGLAVDMTPTDVERMVVLNAVTYAKLSQLYGRDMKRRRRGRILMVSSMAGLCNAAPNTAVYGATKAFGKSLSLSMAKEMEPFGVGVTCLLPGAVEGTQFRARSGTQRALCWSMPFYPRSPEAVAHQGIVSVLDGDSQTIPGWQNRVFATIIRPIIPQRFEIMTVQAAFSPLRLPRIKDIFSRDNFEGTVGEDVEDPMPRPPSKSSDEGSSWISLIESRYKTQPLPRILTLPESQPKMEIQEEYVKMDEQQMVGASHVDKEVDLPLSDVEVKQNSTPADAAEDESDVESDFCQPQSTSVPVNETSAKKEPETAPKEKFVATVELEDDVSSRIEKEVEQQPAVQPRKEQTQSVDDNSDRKEVYFPQESATATTSEKSEVWNDGEESPFSPKFWSDNIDAPFSPRLLSTGDLKDTFQVNRSLLTEILSLVTDSATKQKKQVDLSMESLEQRRSMGMCRPTLRCLPLNVPCWKTFGQLHHFVPKFTIPKALLVSLSLGSCLSTSAAALVGRPSRREQSFNRKKRLSLSVRSIPFQCRKIASGVSRSLTSSKTDLGTHADSEGLPHNVMFVAPLLDYGYPPAVHDLSIQQNQTVMDNNDDDDEKPILLYLPGFDGTYICPFLQYPELGTEFEVWCLIVGMNDRSTYQELKAIVLDFIANDLNGGHDDGDGSDTRSALTFSTQEMSNNKTRDYKQGTAGSLWRMFGGSNGSSQSIERKRKARSRPIYLAGESFGGILAADVSLTILAEKRNSLKYRDSSKANLQGLVLINPATCYDRSQLAIKGPQVSHMPNALYLMGLFGQLLPLFTDEYSVEQLGLILRAKALPSVIDNPQREAYMGRVAISLPTKLEFMPPGTLSWRLQQWLQTGCAAMRESSFKSFPKFRTLIVVGENDKTLPSIAEAERLANKVMLPSQTQIHVVEGAGHASTCGSRLDLAAVMRKHFVELQKPRKKKVVKQPKHETEESCIENEKRTSMKTSAQEGEGPFFGMEERYDKAKIGLNPILYWSKSNYRAVQSRVEKRLIHVPDSDREVSYKKTKYNVTT